MALQLTAAEKAVIDSLEPQLETGFMTGANYTPFLQVVPPLEGYDKPMIIQGVDKTAEFKPLIKGPFKMLIAALLKGLQGWQTPGLLNSWANYDLGGFNGAGYYMDFMGTVHLRGLVKLGTVSYTTTGTIFLLPAGYRPLKELIYATAAADAFGQVRIGSNGEVRFVQGSNAWVTLEGITFRAEQ